MASTSCPLTARLAERHQLSVRAVVGALRGWLPGRTRGARPVEVPASVALPALDGLEPYRTRNGNLSLRPATEADDDDAGPAGDAD